MIDVEKQKKEQLLIEKRKKLAEKYNFWLKKNRVRLAVASSLYLVVIIINYFFIKNTKINLAASLLIFSYAIYVYTIHWYTKKYLLETLDTKTDI